jgi:hypothetical protein
VVTFDARVETPGAREHFSPLLYLVESVTYTGVKG